MGLSATGDFGLNTSCFDNAGVVVACNSDGAACSWSKSDVWVEASLVVLVISVLSAVVKVEPAESPSSHGPGCPSIASGHTGLVPAAMAASTYAHSLKNCCISASRRSRPSLRLVRVQVGSKSVGHVTGPSLSRSRVKCLRFLLRGWSLSR